MGRRFRLNGTVEKTGICKKQIVQQISLTICIGGYSNMFWLYHIAICSEL